MWDRLRSALSIGKAAIARYKYRSADPADSPRVVAADHAAARLPAALAFDLVGGDAVLSHAVDHEIGLGPDRGVAS